MDSCCMIERVDQNVFQVTIKGQFAASGGSELRKALERMMGGNVQVILQNVSLPHHIDFLGLANLVDGLRMRQLSLIQACHPQGSSVVRSFLESTQVGEVLQSIDEGGACTH